MDDNEMPPFASLLRALREQAGLTQEELAERAGLSADAIGLLERGERRRPQRYTVDRLAAALAVAGDERARFVAAARAAASQPQAQTAAAGLPAPATPFFGRDDELAALIGILAPPGARLVTLTGPGGVGKTRLALAVAAWLTPRFADGVAFVPLAALDDPALVAGAIARALGLPERPRQTPESLLASALQGRQLLLVLDNCEHLLAATPLFADLLASCPRLVLLATSRAPLHLAAERQFPVAPFAVPDDAQLADPNAVQNPALALFAERARAVSPAFALSDANRAPVAAICRRLDGLPLAIELAAAWTKALPPRALLTRLARRLPLLAGGARDLPARHRTLRDAIAWSDALLPRRERALFRRLSIFVGGWTLEAAEAACTARGAGAGETLAALAALVDASLVLPPAEEVAWDGEPRYGMLETVREYASGELAGSDEMEAIRNRHLRYFLDLVERADAHLVGPDEGRWLGRLEAEHPNLRAALRGAIERGDADAAMRFAAVLWRFWATRGHLDEGRRWLGSILALVSVADGGDSEVVPTIPPLRRAMLLHVAGNLARTQGDYDAAIPLYEECLAIRRAHGDEQGMAAAMHNLGIIAHEQGDDATAVRRYEEGLPLVRRAGHTYGVAFNLASLADALLALGSVAQAIARYEESRTLFGEIGHTWGIAHTLIGLGNARRAANDLERAADLFREAAALEIAIGHHQGTAAAFEGLAARAGGGTSAHGIGERAGRLQGAHKFGRLAFFTTHGG
ncbi:MAG: tetratricopeptide repeat protein [Thermomicrobia bacterium]|nr:tetratricopeptide repeat protein [Thermomicrobia bacterium]